MAQHTYTATVQWRRDGGDFAKGRNAACFISSSVLTRVTVAGPG
jgi:hypothetical protein